MIDMKRFKKDTDKVDTPHIETRKNEYNKNLYRKFLGEYDNGKLEFPDLQFRKGASFTCDFGLENGFKYINGSMEWGYVRIHQGTDRARGGTEEFSWGTVEDVVRNPFYANRTRFIDYGDKSYGTLISLYNDEYGFEFRIAHMNPDTKNRKGNEKGSIIPWTLKQIKKGKPLDRNIVLGSAGTYGASSGAHTHTEIKSIDEECEVLELLLLEKFGEEANKEYTNEEVIELFRKQKKYKKEKERVIFSDYKDLRKERSVLFLNKYKCQYVDWNGKVRTRYCTKQLFNGL